MAWYSSKENKMCEGLGAGRRAALAWGGLGVFGGAGHDLGLGGGMPLWLPRRAPGYDFGASSQPVSEPVWSWGEMPVTHFSPKPLQSHF